MGLSRSGPGILTARGTCGNKKGNKPSKILASVV